MHASNCYTSPPTAWVQEGLLACYNQATLLGVRCSYLVTGGIHHA